MKKSHRLFLTVFVAVSLPVVGCTLITEVDRSKIPDNAGGAGGEGTGGSVGGQGGQAATGGQGGDSNVGGAGGAA